MHPQVQTLLSMLGLQEERVAHPRVRDIDSRCDYHDVNDIDNYDRYNGNIVFVLQVQRACFDKVMVSTTPIYLFRASLPHLPLRKLTQIYCEHIVQYQRKICFRARRVDAPPRQAAHAFANHFQQQPFQFAAGKMQQNQYENSFNSQKLEGTNNNNFQGGGSRSGETGGEPIGGEITPNCVCRCTCCPCCPCNPGEEDYLQYID